MRKELFLHITERLKTIHDEHGQSIIQHFGLWNKNAAFMKQETFGMPAVFIEFPSITWADLPHSTQEATITVKLHIMTVYNTPDATNDPDQQQAFEHFDLIDRINVALHRFPGINSNSFTHTESITNHDHEGILDNQEVYTMHVFTKL